MYRDRRFCEITIKEARVSVIKTTLFGIVGICREISKS